MKRWHENQRIVFIVHKYASNRRFPSAAVSFLVCRVKYCLFNKFLMMHDISPTEYDSRVERQQLISVHTFPRYPQFNKCGQQSFQLFFLNFSISHLPPFCYSSSFRLKYNRLFLFCTHYFQKKLTRRINFVTMV